MAKHRRKNEGKSYPYQYKGASGELVKAVRRNGNNFSEIRKVIGENMLDRLIDLNCVTGDWILLNRHGKLMACSDMVFQIAFVKVKRGGVKEDEGERFLYDVVLDSLSLF